MEEQSAEGHSSFQPNTQPIDLQKKKKKRRKRRRRGSTIEDKKWEPDHLSIYSPSASPSTINAADRRARRTGPPTPVLRPVGAQVPRAPENSTQFIMDDHENSALFIDFSELKDLSTNNEGNAESGDELDEGTATPRLRDWFPFSVEDFESAYRSAREDRMMGASRTDLRAAIVALEARAAVLTDALSAHPSRLLARLQVQLLALQEENEALHSALGRRNPHRYQIKREQDKYRSSSSSSSSDSDTDSSGTSSTCSDSECDACQDRHPTCEEEKENTRPQSVTPDS